MFRDGVLNMSLPGAHMWIILSSPVNRSGEMDEGLKQTAQAVLKVYRW